MDATLAGLLQDCATSVDDFTPHRILADWLEDRDQPERAELIRVQCQLAGWVPDWQQRRVLIDRQKALIEANRDLWVGSILAACERVEFLHGLAHLRITSRNFCTVNFGEVFTQASATVLPGSVRLIQCGSLSRVVNRPWLALVHWLNLSGLDLKPESFDLLGRSENVPHLAALDLSDTPLDGPTLDGFLATPLARRLLRLRLRNTTFGDHAVRKLLRLGDLLEVDIAGVDLPFKTRLEFDHLRPARVVRNSLGMEFVCVPAGSFLMGSAGKEQGALSDQYPQHPVTLTRDFCMGRFAVTQSQFTAVTGNNPSRFASAGWNRPVENVNFDQAIGFCNALSRRPEEREAGRRYRLPTEAEWEYAARAGSFTQYSWGGDSAVDRMNYRGRYNSDAAEQPHPGRTMPVGSYPPNAFGLYEMHGNIWEWTGDYYHDNYYLDSPAADPTGPYTGETRTIRGGCWHAVGICCRAAHRFGEETDTEDDFTGFRVVMETRESA